MRVLQQLIEQMSPSEQKEFRQVLLRTGRIGHRKDVDLFDALIHDDRNKKNAPFFGLYKKEEYNAYHSLRKRLIKQLEQFLAYSDMVDRNTDELSAENRIRMARYAMDKDAHELAFHYLEAAEELAGKKGEWELLDTVYQQMIRHSMVFGLHLDDVLKKWEANKERIALNEKLMVASSLIQQKLHDARQRGTTLQLQEITNLTLRRFKIEKEAWTQPRFMLTIASMIRSAVISTRDYYRFETYVERMYNALKKSKSMGRDELEIELNFLYMLAHVQYRNRKFSKCIQSLEQINELTTGQRTPHSRLFRSRYILLRAAVDSYTGNNEAAIQHLVSALRSSSNSTPVAARLNMQLNLCVYYFQAKNYKASNKIMHSIQHSDQWLEKKMGVEWNFKKNLIAVLLQYELGHEDIAWTMVRSLEKKYGAFLRQPFYQRAGIFIGFIKALLTDPDQARTNEFASKVDKAIVALPGDREDIQAVTFFCWLKAKMSGREYYDVLLEVIGERAS